MASTYNTVATGAIVLEVLNQNNYKEWSARVETYLLSKDLWDVVKEDPPEAENGLAEYKAWRIKNAKALHAIKISCGTETFSFVREITLAKTAWEVLGKKFRLRPIIKRTETKSSDLYIAAVNKEVHTVKELLSSTREEDLEMRDGYGRTALDGVIVAACRKAHWIQIARAMVEKNRDIVKITSWPGKYIPVVRAVSQNKWEMARCLFSLTPGEAFLSDNGRQGAELITMCIWHPKGLDFAWKVLQQYPRLAMAENGLGQQPMLVLAGNCSAYPSEARVTLWQRLIYKGISIRPIEFCIPESRITVSESEDELSTANRSRANQGLQRTLFCSVTSLFREAFTGTSQFLGIHDVYKLKLNHLRFEKFLSCMVPVIKDLDNLTTAELNVVRASLFKAIAQGHVEFVKQMFEANPAVVDIFDDNKKSIFQYAIECRQENVYNLIYELKPEKRDDITHNIAKFQTNMLHSAAHMSSAKHSKHVQDASLQMQRELQWFKEVESMLPSEMHEFVNTSNLTARELFIRNHKKLKDEAEVSFKGVAASCSTVGTLILTSMFAPAFAGVLPLYTNRIYILSNTISLVSSAVSVITFLGLLTSTYAEEDFLWSLPTKMTIGLLSLFISVVTMMITYACTLSYLFDGDATMIFTGRVLATVPVVSFAFFLFPLLSEICIRTYGPSMFGKKA